MRMRKRQRKNKNININQIVSFEDYVETNRKINIHKKQLFKIEFIYYFSCLFH